jgi:prolyl 4-hydroxylase
MAADSGFVPAQRAVGYLAMQHESSRNLAIDCLRQAAHSGDPVSSFNLGWCLLQGWGGDDTKHEAVQWLQRAADAEYPFAETLLTPIRDVQAGPQPRFSDARIELGASFSIYPESQNVDHQVVSADPPITLFKDVLNIVDCAYLIFLSRPYLERAVVIDPGSERGGMVSDVRTNMSTHLPFEIVDFIGRYIELKIISETGEDLMSSEPMSILRYARGAQYRPHFDYFDPKLTASKGLMEFGGQRTASAVTYLASPSAGGGTSFPNLNVSVLPFAGSTLWFRNCLEDGQIDDRSLHAGDPVEQGEKWVVTKWFRERPTRYVEL